ncbi:glycoside hydrolase family 2 protein [Flavobacterium sufflavum]|uniref:Glycoside hydrolase family 2 protein n=1 Tax=Flavobacterium sufflavum TaxID=1921138 RepID=A0A437L2V4_9FLAO|nr:glycoside hydrolase family 2 TIM barrel-domain containing protein [Flavobacterium sufflavum]RVT79637.1 glycoside hydrolase family 2 protein [Flavobacterium sufflavum]
MKNTTTPDKLNQAYSISTVANSLKRVYLFILTSIITVSPSMAQSNSNTRTISFDKDWAFTKTNVIGAEQIHLDDSKWRKVNLPHDWSIEDLANQEQGKVQGPFSKNSIGKAPTGWTVGGTAWYQKKFVTEKNKENKLVSIHFDGVYMNADVWLNGVHLGNHPYGYTPFYYDLTPYLKSAGEENIIAVKVRNEGKNSRWYSGSGIYRHVWLTVTDPVHVDTWGINITTPEVTQDKAIVKISSTIKNKQASNSDILLVTNILNPSGKIVGSTQKKLQLEAGKSIIDEQTVTISNPALWSLETPQLYKAITEIKNGDKTIDEVETNFGIRSIKFDGTEGFSLNGKKLILKGGCIHHDNGPLGAVSVYKAEERKIEILKKNGYNAIRASHNPPSQALLDACDKLGMLVMNEAFDTWIKPKNPEDYNLNFNAWWQKDLEAMILRDRNHPSIIMWSIGNEIYEAPDLIGQEIGKKLANEVRKLDPTRPVTEAMVYLPPYTQTALKDYKSHLENLDVDGYNYFLESKSIHFQRDSATVDFFDTQHAAHPQKTYVVTESLPLFALENWEKSERSPYMIGSFKWTAFDYIGEAGIGKSRIKPERLPELKGIMGMGQFFKDEWPIFNSGTGDFDLIGNKKQASYYQDVVWRNSPIEILVHNPIPEGMKEAVATWGFPDVIKSWTWPGQEGKKMQVHVYTRSKVVKLELNGKLIAEQIVPEGSITAIFEIEYQPGTLVAKGFDGEKKTGESTLITTGKPSAIRLSTDRSTINADLNDLSYINVEIIDQKGNIVPNVDDLEITYQLTGNASIAGVGNGNVADMSSFQQNHKKVYQGRGLVILRPNEFSGKITLKAQAKGLAAGQIEIRTK